MRRLACSRFRRALLPLLVASLAVAVTPAVHVEAKGPVRIAASELRGSLGRERTFALPLAASHLALKDTSCGEVSNRLLTLGYGTTGTQVVNDTVANWRNVLPCGN